MTDRAVQARRAPCGERALAAAVHGRDGRRSHSPRLLAVLRRAGTIANEKGNPFESAIKDYYVHVDRLIGRLIETCDPAKTAFLRHPPTTARSGWKAASASTTGSSGEGYLVLKQPVSRARPGSSPIWSTGRRRGPGPRAAITAASTSTSGRPRAAGHRSRGRLRKPCATS